MYSAIHERGYITGFYVDALARVDLALYDILGKALNQPVYKVLGGRFREEIPVYAGLGGTEPVAVAGTAAKHVGWLWILRP